MDKMQKRKINRNEARKIYDCEVVEYQDEFRLLLDQDVGINLRVPKESFYTKDDLGKELDGEGCFLVVQSHLLAERLGLDVVEVDEISEVSEVGFIFGNWTAELPSSTSYEPMPDFRVTDPRHAKTALVILRTCRTTAWSTVLPQLAKLSPLLQMIQVKGLSIAFAIPLNYCPIRQNAENDLEFEAFRQSYTEATYEIATNEWNNTIRNGME